MSRIGKSPISIPEGVTVEIKDNLITVKGKLGELTQDFSGVEITTEDGTLTVTPSKSVLDGAFMVLVDGEEWDDVEINGNEISVMFLAGAEEIEIIGTFVVPEFGAIAALILAVAIISIIAVSAKSRLSIMPRL